VGLYFRRSVRVGPLRFNFSKSGIGVSTGIPGFRVGTGPRGAYVHVGAGGLYYRQSLGSSLTEAAETRQPGAHGLPSYAGDVEDRTVGPLEDTDSASVLELTDASSQRLLDEIQQRRATPRVAPWIAGIGIAAFFVAGNAGVGELSIAVVGAVMGGLFWWASGRDALRRTVVIGYDLDAVAAEHFEALINAWKALAGVGGLWHIPAQVHDRKYHAGASTVLNRVAVRPATGEPPGIRTNIDVPFIRVGRQQLYFMPDRVLVFDGSQVGAVEYSSLLVEVGTTRFVEDGSVPGDAQVVDHTWRYVNQDGGPDRRFANNAQLPIALYETIHLTSSSGLNELLHVSRVGVGPGIASASAKLAAMAHPTEPGQPIVPIARSPDAAHPEADRLPDGPERLRTGETAEIIAGRGPGWEHRAFAAAMTEVMRNPPAVPAPAMPEHMVAAPEIMAWARDQLAVPPQILDTVKKLIEADLPAAFGLPGPAGDPDAIVLVAWNVGYQAAGAKIWAAAVRSTAVPPRYTSLREELARTVDQPLRQLAECGPALASALDRVHRAPEGSMDRSLDLNLKFTIENQVALEQAMQESLR
jgi:multisubunit Na+/H+ antiporter MnhB subunit